MKFLPPSGLLPGGRCIDHGDPATTSAEKKVALALEVNLVHFSTEEEGGRNAHLGQVGVS